MVRKKTLLVMVALVLVAVVAVAAVASSYQSMDMQYEGASITKINFKSLGYSDMVRLTVGLMMFPSDGGALLLSTAASLIDTVNVNLTLNATNGGFVPLWLGSFDFDLYVNNYYAGNGSHAGSIFIQPGASALITINQTIKVSGLANATIDAIGNSGLMVVRVEGRAHAAFLDIPFSNTQTIDIKEGLRDAVSSLFG
ncbi:MAG: LEA type 2 family protein [Candidatus Methanomethylicia archaeon]|nr:LEA type 2 family protein [Candidatus Methanomethylicia archaeon]